MNIHRRIGGTGVCMSDPSGEPSVVVYVVQDDLVLVTIVRPTVVRCTEVCDSTADPVSRPPGWVAE